MSTESVGLYLKSQLAWNHSKPSMNFFSRRGVDHQLRPGKRYCVSLFMCLSQANAAAPEVVLLKLYKRKRLDFMAESSTKTREQSERPARPGKKIWMVCSPSVAKEIMCYQAKNEVRVCGKYARRCRRTGTIAPVATRLAYAGEIPNPSTAQPSVGALAGEGPAGPSCLSAECDGALRWLRWLGSLLEERLRKGSGFRPESRRGILKIAESRDRSCLGAPAGPTFVRFSGADRIIANSPQLKAEGAKGIRCRRLIASRYYLFSRILLSVRHERIYREFRAGRPLAVGAR